MAFDVKKQIRDLFPNLTDTWNLEKKKRYDKKLIKKIDSLDETEYPSYLADLYLKRTGNKLCIESPIRFTEKLQFTDTINFGIII